MNPSTLIAGSSSATITLGGSNFDSGSSVIINGVSFPALPVAASSLIATVSGAFLQAPGEVSVLVKNSSGIQSNSMPLQILAPLKASATQLASGQVSVAYTSSMQAAGGTPPYTWALSSGTVPNGLSFHGDGSLSGTPSLGGTTTFTVTLSDSGAPSQSASATETLTISPATLVIATPNFSTATVGSTYSASVSASGGTGAYAWAVTSGNLPTGLSIAASTGMISGSPTASGISNFTLAVSDSGSPTQQSLISGSISVSPAQLGVATTALPSAIANSVYTAKFQATGGTPNYVWSLASGSLPSGLNLGSDGTLSGTPTVAGTAAFVVRVTDTGSPTQTQVASMSIQTNATTPAINPGITWYVRPDGGTRYTSARVANGLSAQCDGKHDAPYPGSGVNQPCAFNDYRFLWDDQAQYGVVKWVIAGGDTVILRGGPWRVGFDQGASNGDVWCRGGSGPYGCTNPPIPAGTPTQHTRILGENYAACHNNNVADKSKMTQIFGGFGVYTPMNIAGTQNLDIQCLEITRHSQCTLGGDPAYPAPCSKSGPIDDYDSDGVEEDAQTANVNMTDLWIHGHPGRGVKGPIGGLITATRVDIAYNEGAGWDFDDGNATPFGPNAEWHFDYSTIEWSGCYQEYPIVHNYPAISCYGQSNQGYGDGVGTAPGQELDVYIDHSVFRYNTQDGEDFGHVDGGTHQFSVTNSVSYANGGAAFKWGWGFTNILFENNIAMANCRRMSAPIDGAPGTYNANLGDFCRAGDALSFNFEDGTQALFANNTIVTYAGTTFDEKCVPITSQGQTNCNNAVFTLRNNIVRGYSNAAYDYGGHGAPTVFCGTSCNGSTQNIGTINRDHNIFYGFRPDFEANTQTPGSNVGYSSNEAISDPMFVGEPAADVSEATLDDYVVSLTSGSPARGAGASLPDLLTDFSGLLYSLPPSIGAVEYSTGSTISVSTPIN